MEKNIIIKSLFNGVISCLGLALIQSAIKGMPFTQNLVEPRTLILSACAAVCSFIGFSIRAAMQ